MVASGNAGEFTVPGTDGDFITAEDAANSSRGAGSHISVLQEGAVKVVRQDHCHRRGRSYDSGVLSLCHFSF